jgi:hypothetical protein
MTIRKEIRSTPKIIEDIAYRKHQAAKARFGKKLPNIESPRKVYLTACTQIASVFIPLGYKYAKSGPHTRCQNGDFTFQISFQSSHHNVADEYIALWIHAHILSQRLKNWREQQTHAIRSTDYVAGGQIGNLVHDHSWMEWDLADPQQRESTVADAVHTIKQLALPFFEQFKNLDVLINGLQTETLPAMDILSVIEFLLCFRDVVSARWAGRNFLMRHPQFVAQYEQELEHYKTQGLPKWPESGWGRDLAFASIAYKLPFLE